MLFDNDGNCQMLNNETEFCYAHWQIAKNKLEGYFLVNVKEFINNPNKYKKYRINNTGTVEEYPLNMFTSVEQLSGEILSIRFKEE